MAKSVLINSVVYPDTPEIQAPINGGGTAHFMETSDATLDSNAKMLNGVTAYAGGTKYTGSIQSKAAATYTPSASQQSINAGQYLSGAQTIEAVVCTNLSAANIKSGVTVKIGTASDDDSVATVTGSLTAATISQDGVTKILSIS